MRKHDTKNLFCETLNWAVIIKIVSQQLKHRSEVLTISWLTINPPPLKEDWDADKITIIKTKPKGFNPLGRKKKKLARTIDFNINVERVN